MWFFHGSVTIDYCCGHNVGVIRVDTADGDGFTKKIDVAVAIAGICARLDFDNIAVSGIVDSCLNVIEIRLPIVIDGDYSCLAGNHEKQPYKDDNCLFHSANLRC